MALIPVIIGAAVGAAVSGGVLLTGIYIVKPIVETVGSWISNAVVEWMYKRNNYHLDQDRNSCLAILKWLSSNKVLDDYSTFSYVDNGTEKIRTVVNKWLTIKYYGYNIYIKVHGVGEEAPVVTGLTVMINKLTWYGWCDKKKLNALNYFIKEIYDANNINYAGLIEIRRAKEPFTCKKKKL